MRHYNRFKPRRRRSSVWTKVFLLVLILGAVVLAVTRYIPQFERVPPQIVAPKSTFWSMDVPLKVKLSDNRALGSYQAVLTDGQTNIVVASNRFIIPIRSTDIELKMPKEANDKIKSGTWKLLVQVCDTSLINKIYDNCTVAAVDIEADTKPPVVNLLAKSKTIAKGGSALVVFEANDTNLKSVYIEAGGKRFMPQIYKQKPYYATLIAWPYRQKHLGAQIVAIDRAGNKTIKKLGFEVVYKKYQVSWIHATNHFIKGRITEVAKTDPQFAHIANPVERFKAVNEAMRLKNEKLIHKLASRISNKPIDGWIIHRFYPLKSAKLVADFGVERHYYYDNPKKEISRAYHLGFDLASVRHAPIISSNAGRVIYAAKNGIYGNMPMIDHGFGLCTLYGHCSQVFVEKGDEVKAGEMIARTGKTGLALGDHLHFGILVHGIEVWPMDWMEENWIRKNISDVFKKANQNIKREYNK
jgi:murein DD-endopeptidase MepM/ murein hydrolase activator NlpD